VSGWELSQTGASSSAESVLRMRWVEKAMPQILLFPHPGRAREDPGHLPGTIRGVRHLPTEDFVRAITSWSDTQAVTRSDPPRRRAGR
jgi:hypothetical protein